MDEKKIIKLDLTGCKYLGELHERIRIAFGFPEWYGANWDAFWDLLRSECDADEVIILGINTLPVGFENEKAKMETVLERFKLNCEKYGNVFNYNYS